MMHSAMPQLYVYLPNILHTQTSVKGTSCRLSRVAVVAIVSVIIVIAVVPAVVLTRIKKNKPAATSTNIPSNISLSGGIEHCPGGSPGDAVKCMFQPQVCLLLLIYVKCLKTDVIRASLLPTASRTFWVLL